MRHKGLAAVASLGAVTSAAAAIAALQVQATEKSADTTWLWIIAAVFAAVMIAGSLGWFLTRGESTGSGTTIKQAVSPSHAIQIWRPGANVQNIGGDQINYGAAQPEAPAKPEPSAEDKAIQALGRLSYEIGGVTVNGKELFSQVADKLVRRRDAFLFGQEVAAALRVESRSVPEQEILNDLVMLGLVNSEYYAPPAEAGAQSGVARPESPHQYVISDLGKNVLAALKTTPRQAVLRVRSDRRQDTAGLYIRNCMTSKITTAQVSLSYLSLPFDEGGRGFQDDPFFSTKVLAWSFDYYGAEHPDQSVIEIPAGDERFIDVFVRSGTELKIVAAHHRIRDEDGSRVVLPGRYKLRLVITADQFSAIPVDGYEMEFTEGSWRSVIVPKEERDLFTRD